ncbi:MAG: hypothetical protein A2Z78_02075 [Candidatus Nealsonbacteria bacterium RBG_13_36_15]|uniref:Zinc metalloprotease n=1 Tax=Candidatus Nealsonbacteria bacterium RBG_13_36_15 TaxID=1801660 RepID=A0A1G2DV85_9BACT|nr:MAG: hypothetical protein A2Z78_02075 [Candidatus Nealsonbacteria bacterium RBG_13_36_15]
MILTIFIAFFSLIGLVVLHELGHFIMAKRFGVKVEEFGVGLPPRIFGKKFGETIYSINLLPFGAFVKIYGEEKSIEDYRSFSQKPIWQRVFIIIGGVVVFWIVAFVILSIVMVLGVTTIVDDEANHNLVDSKVQIVQVVANSPAETAGLRIGDTVRELEADDGRLVTDKEKEVRDFIAANRGEKIIFKIQRGSEIFETSLTPRYPPPEKEGAAGIALARTATVKYSWYRAPLEGLSATVNLTIAVIQGWVMILKNIVIGEGLPPGAQILGPVGIMNVFTQMAQLGINYFLRFIALISIYLAVFNILPIPALDGGKLVFLGIEAVRKKPVPQGIEQKLTIFFFALLMILIAWATIRDIIRIF